jgi:hypothetical protein
VSSTALQKQVARDHQCARGKRACASPTVCRSKGACSEAWRDLTPTVTRCAQCAWEHRGSALEGRLEFRSHHARKHRRAA